MPKRKTKPVTQQPEASAKETLSDIARNSDVTSMIDRVRSMSEILAEIAVEQQHDKPDIAARAAMGAARAASEVISGLVIKERVEHLDRMAKEALEAHGLPPPPEHQFQRPKDDIIGLSEISGAAVKLPNFGYPKNHRQQGDDQDETQGDTGPEGHSEPGLAPIPDW